MIAGPSLYRMTHRLARQLRILTRWSQTAETRLDAIADWRRDVVAPAFAAVDGRLAAVERENLPERVSALESLPDDVAALDARVAAIEALSAGSRLTTLEAERNRALRASTLPTEAPLGVLVLVTADATLWLGRGAGQPLQQIDLLPLL